MWRAAVGSCSVVGLNVIRRDNVLCLIFLWEGYDFSGRCIAETIDDLTCPLISCRLSSLEKFLLNKGLIMLLRFLFTVFFISQVKVNLFFTGKNVQHRIIQIY